MSKIIGGLKTDTIVTNDLQAVDVEVDLDTLFNAREKTLSDPTTQTQSWYEFKSGSELVDSSGNSNTLTEVGTGSVTFLDNFGGLSNVAQTTSDTHLEPPGTLAAQFADQDFTFTCWFNRNSITSTEYPLLYLCLANDPGTSFSISVLDGQIRIQNPGKNSVSVPLSSSNTTTYNDGLWHHLTVIITENPPIVYIDGVDETSNFTVVNTPSPSIEGGWKPVGQLDTVYVGAISDGIPDSAYVSPIALYTFDRGYLIFSGNGIELGHDSISPHARGLFLNQSGVTQDTTDPSPRDRVGVFDGTASLRSIPPFFTDFSATTLTIAFWMKATSTTAGTIIFLEDTTAFPNITTLVVSLNVTLPGINVISTVNNVVTLNVEVFIPVSGFLTGTWNHIAITFRDTGSPRNEIYSNGFTLPPFFINYIVGDDDTFHGITNPIDNPSIGNNSSETVGTGFIGSLDDVFFSSAYLNSTQILAIANVSTAFPTLTRPSVTPYITTQTTHLGTLTQAQILDIYNGSCIDQPFTIKGDLAVNNLRVTSLAANDIVASGSIRGSADGQLLNIVSINDISYTGITAGVAFTASSGTPGTEIFDYSYSKVAANSHLIVTFDVNYTIAGSGLDRWESRLYIDGSEVQVKVQLFAGSGGTGTRSGTLYSIRGVGFISGSGSVSIQSFIKEVSSDDQVTVQGDNTLTIFEVAGPLTSA